MRKVFGMFVAVLSLISAGLAHATPWIDVSSIDVETGPVATLALTILGALAAIWVVRKLIKLSNRS